MCDYLDSDILLYQNNNNMQSKYLQLKTIGSKILNIIADD